MVGRVGLDAADDVHSAEDLAEDDVAAIAPRGGYDGDKELKREKRVSQGHE